MAKIKIQPLGDRVLVEEIEETEQIKGGIVIPDSAKEKPQEAKVTVTTFISVFRCNSSGIMPL